MIALRIVRGLGAALLLAAALFSVGTWAGYVALTAYAEGDTLLGIVCTLAAVGCAAHLGEIRA